MSHIPDNKLSDEFVIKNLDPANDAAAISALITASYPEIRAYAPDVTTWVHRPVHDPELWIGVFSSEALIGCGIADTDIEAGEVSLDWIQVHPAFRGYGIGKFLVCEILRRAATRTDFATVSGDADNESSPEHLYRSCGFTGDDIWHVYR
ncbi:MAG: GNAT family N-acetyltransferase [Propionibacteriaceae bacterium]